MNPVQLLVSVRSAGEAAAALSGGADLIDVKEPARGSLGAAEPAVWREVAALLSGRTKPLSIALGELHERDLPAWEALAPQVPLATAFAKLGLAQCAADPYWPQRWATALAALPKNVGRVAVIYADYANCAAPRPEEILALAAQHPLAAVLIDTYDKARGNLFAALPETKLLALAESVRRMGLPLALAGSLQRGDVPRALALAPDWLAVRSAVCAGARTAAVSAPRVAQLAADIRAAAALSSGRRSSLQKSVVKSRTAS